MQLFFLLKKKRDTFFFNIGLGKDYKIKEYYKVIASSMNYYPGIHI